MNNKKYKLIDGKVVQTDDLMDWASWYENTKERIIKQTRISSHIQVSTVFLGIDHNFSGCGPPILFEIMVFGGEHDGYCVRLCTLNQAKTGHKLIVEGIQKSNLDKKLIRGVKKL